MDAEDVVTILLEDSPPPRFFPGSNDDERKNACRSAFTAYDYALNVDKGHHPDTWKAVQGSPYERQYQRQFMS